MHKLRQLLKTKYSALLLAFPFIAIYILVRSLPVEPCDFLHEETATLKVSLITVVQVMQDLLTFHSPLANELDFRPLILLRSENLAVLK